MSIPDSPGALAVLGLDPAGQAAYELLVDRAAATLADLAAVWSRPEDLETALSTLEERGLVSTVPGGVVRYTAIAPGMAFQSMLLDCEERLDAARAHLAVLEAAYQDRPVERDASTVVEAVTGARAVRQRLVQIRRWARREVRCLDRPPYLEPDGGEAGAAELLGRGLACRTIYDRSSLDHDGALAGVERLIRAGQQARVHPHLPIKLYLVDDRLALLPLPADGAIVVHPSALLDALVKLFDALWQRALPLDTAASPAGSASPASPASAAGAGSPAGAGGPAAARRRLVALLLSGLTEEAIARQLGLSYRSVQRRVAALTAELGAHTRFQAGAQAALRRYPDAMR